MIDRVVIAGASGVIGAAAVEEAPGLASGWSDPGLIALPVREDRPRDSHANFNFE